MVTQDHVTNLKHFISTTTMPMATKHGRAVTYHGVGGVSHPESRLTISSLGFARSHGKLQISYPHYNYACDQQTYQGGGLHR